MRLVFIISVRAIVCEKLLGGGFARTKKKCALVYLSQRQHVLAPYIFDTFLCECLCVLLLSLSESENSERAISAPSFIQLGL